MCGSCYLDSSVECWNLGSISNHFCCFIFQCSCEIHFGAPSRFRKDCVISLQNLPSDLIIFFNRAENKKINKYSKFNANFNFWQPVETTWSTHKTKVNLLYGFVVFHEIIVCSTALFNIQRNSFPNKVHFSKSIVETVFFYAWENIATIMNFWITLLNDFFHDNRLHFIGIFTSTLRLIWPLFTLLGSGSEWQKTRRNFWW